jgi:hypothetical protein
MDSVADRAFLEQVRALTAFLKSLPPTGRNDRLPPTIASACISRSRRSPPGSRARRRRVKAAERSRRAMPWARSGGPRSDNIRTLRSRPVFTTPNVFAPRTCQRSRRQPDALRRMCRVRQSRGPATSAKRTTEIHQHTISCVRHVRRSTTGNVRAGGSVGSRGAADRRTREDRLPGWTQTACCGAHLIVTTRSRTMRRRYAPSHTTLNGDITRDPHLDLRHTPSVDGLS